MISPESINMSSYVNITEQVIFRSIYVNTFAYMLAIRVNERRDCLFEKEKGCIWKGLEGGNGRDRCNYIIMPKIEEMGNVILWLSIFLS